MFNSGFRYIPPPSSNILPAANERQCEVCKKGLDEVSDNNWTSRGLSENLSPRFGWPPPATTAAPLPCCEESASNSGGDSNSKVYFCD